MKTVFVIICMNNNISVKPPLIEQVPNSKCFNVGPDLPKDHAMRGELVAFKEKLENLLDQFLVLLHICIFFSIQEVFAHRKFRKNICTQLDCWSSFSNTDSLDHNLGWRKLMMMAQKHLLLNVLTLYLDNIIYFSSFIAPYVNWVWKQKHISIRSQVKSTRMVRAQCKAIIAELKKEWRSAALVHETAAFLWCGDSNWVEFCAGLLLRGLLALTCM